MRITAIKQQVKNPERVSVSVDGKYAFSLSLDELLREKLKKDDEIDEARVKQLKKLSEEGKLKMRTLNWLLMRPHSTRELRDYLRRKKADTELVEAWIEEFTSKKYLDDESFARWWVETRRSGKQSSTKKLSFELRSKGIEREMIDRVLQDAQDDEQAALNELIEKKRRLPRYRADEQKLMEYLVRQGFGYGDVKRSLSADTPFSDDE